MNEIWHSFLAVDNDMNWNGTGMILPLEALSNFCICDDESGGGFLRP